MPPYSTHPTKERERGNTLRVKEDKWAKDEDEAANENKTATHPDPPAQDPKGKAKAEDKKGTPRIPPDPRVTGNLRIPVATAVAPTTLPTRSPREACQALPRGYAR